MTELYFPGVQTALDLTIKGSIGDFQVKVKSGHQTSSVPVKYLTTHIGLSTHGSHEEKLLSRLAPVREVFNIKDLDFDQIMQRDIDDERVSNELIPYLLDDHGARGLVKFFPPIIIAVLAVDKRGNPAAHYPATNLVAEPIPGQTMEWSITRSGSIGTEAFEFRQLKQPDGELIPHDYAELRINTQKCKLAIIDGQHRAMALVALYRNLKGWPEKTAQYEDYYKRWPASKIETYDFEHVRLPIVFCVFPSLGESHSPSATTVPEACRAVFLALNKNAKKVTEARNHLLDDNDLVASFLRALLSKIKSADSMSDTAFRLWNVELDSESDKVAVSSPVALTGVMHLYGLLEKLMLQEFAIMGINPRRSNPWKLTKLTGVWRRLHAKDMIGEDLLDNIRRNNVDRDTEAKLISLFSESYGGYILRCLDEFFPFRAHNLASLARELTMRNSAAVATFHSILFDGQSQGRVFSRYIERMKALREEAREAHRALPPEIDETLLNFEKKKQSLDDEVLAFNQERAERFLADVTPAWLRKSPSMISALNDLYRYNFTTAAFQTAMIIAFFSVIEAVNDSMANDDVRLDHDEVSALLTEYIDSLNTFFRPTSEKTLKDIFRVFAGTVSTERESEKVTVTPSRTLRKILVPGELNPKEWARLRYIFLEIWNTSDPRVAKVIEADVGQCRREAYDRLMSQAQAEYAEDRGISPTKIDESAKAKIAEQCVKDFQTALKPLGRQVSRAELEGPVAAESGGED